MKKRIGAAVALGVIVATFLVPSAAAGGGCYPTGTGMTTTSEPTVQIAECAFEQTVVYIDPGDTVRWSNKDVFAHTVTGAADSWGDQVSLEQGASVAHAFKAEGVYPYYCVFHPAMVGAIVVGDARAPAAMTGGKADVEQAALDVAAPAGVAEPISKTTGDYPTGALVLVILVGIGFGVGATRLVMSRRRAAASPIA